MLKLVIFLVFTLIAGSSFGEGLRLYKDPISGEQMQLKQKEIDGWVVSTALEGKWLILEKKGESVLHIIDGGAGREITVKSQKNVFGAMVIRDKDNDQEYDVITYRREGKEITDIGLDGVIESILDLNDGSMLINYKGRLTQLMGEGKKKHILVNGQKVDVEYVEGKFVPVQ